MRKEVTQGVIIDSESSNDNRAPPKEEKQLCNPTVQKYSFVASTIALLVVSSLLVKYGFMERMGEFLEFVKTLGWLGNFIVCLCFLAISFPFILGAYIPLNLGAGAIYGVLVGTVTVSVGSTGGACIAFWICRAFTRKWLEESLKKRKEFRYFLLMMQGKDRKYLTLLARLSPIPFGLQNSFFALTDISFRDFFLSTWLGLLPFQVVWTHLGTTLINLSKISSGEVELSLWQQLSMLIQLIVGVVLVGYFWYLTKKIKLTDGETPANPEADLESGHYSVPNAVVLEEIT